MQTCNAVNICSGILLLVLLALMSVPTNLLSEQNEYLECDAVSSEREYVYKSIQICKQSGDAQRCLEQAGEKFSNCGFQRSFAHHHDRIQKGMLLVMLFSQGATVSPARLASSHLD